MYGNRTFRNGLGRGSGGTRGGSVCSARRGNAAHIGSGSIIVYSGGRMPPSKEEVARMIMEERRARRIEERRRAQIEERGRAQAEEVRRPQTIREQGEAFLREQEEARVEEVRQAQILHEARDRRLEEQTRVWNERRRRRQAAAAAANNNNIGTSRRGRTRGPTLGRRFGPPAPQR